ncbi:MAG TPA: MerR family transcriptional regulator [Lachnospiraceae bacterium]|nr:MerR family transcriptional regulator [Lachnospiraceae bacterium]
MMTVNEVSKLTGVSIRTLQYYDKIGLLKPAGYTESGYRLYDDTALEMLQQILLFKELEFSLKEIKEILSRPDFDRKKALEQQITLLTMKKEHLENLIGFAREIQIVGGKIMDFSVFDTKKMDAYAKQAKEKWGSTEEYKEFEQKSQNRGKEEEQAIVKEFMEIFAEFGKLRDMGAESAEAQNQVKKLQDYITDNFYHCSEEILFSLGQMYAGGGEFTDNVDKAGGKGTAEFTAEAIRVYCRR